MSFLFQKRHALFGVEWAGSSRWMCAWVRVALQDGAALRWLVVELCTASGA
jgi:hypothetical protein